MSGHWALHGFGMFAVEEKSSGKYVGRVGPVVAAAAGPALRSAGASPANFAARATRWRRRGRRSTGCSRLSSSIEIIHCIDLVNAASQGVARRLGARKDREGELFGKPAGYLGDVARVVGRAKSRSDPELD